MMSKNTDKTDAEKPAAKPESTVTVRVLKRIETESCTISEKHPTPIRMGKERAETLAAAGFVKIVGA